MTRSTSRALRVLGALVAVAIVLGLAVPAVARMLEHTVESQHTLPPEATRVTVDSDVGSLTIRAAGPDEAPRAVAVARSSFREPRVEVRTDGDRATLHARCTGLNWVERCEVAWDIVVPAGADVDVRTAVGDVAVTGVAGNLTAHTSVGDITVAQSGSATVDLRSSVGDVDMTQVVVPEAVSVRTSTGDVRVTVPGDATYRLQSSTSIGETRSAVGDDPASERVLDLQTSIGDITVSRN